MAICVACHPRGTYTTTAFRTAWNGRPLSELFDLVREKMPKSDPGSLTPAEYAQAIAYLLKINDVPAGEHELPPDGEALKKIRIEWPAAVGTPRASARADEQHDDCVTAWRTTKQDTRMSHRVPSSIASNQRMERPASGALTCRVRRSPR